MDAESLYDQFLPGLQKTYGPREAHSMLHILWEDLLGFPRGQKRGQITTAQAEKLTRAIGRIQRGEPLQYVVGFTYFLGLKIHVSPAVLIPRPETEELVLWILETVQENGLLPGKILDMGTGSGCIPIALQYKLPSWQCEGMDVSEEALEIARKNATENQLPLSFWQDNLLEISPEQLSDYSIWVSNPPYIGKEEAASLPKNVLDHEPGKALFVTNDDPLQFYRAIADLASQQEGGKLTYIFLECHESYAEEVKALFFSLPQTIAVELKLDFQGKPRMIRVTLNHPS